MCLHVTALFIHTFIVVATQILVVYTYFYPGPLDYNIMVMSKMAVETS